MTEQPPEGHETGGFQATAPHGRQTYHVRIISFPQGAMDIVRGLQRGMAIDAILRQYREARVHILSAEHKPRRDYIEVLPGETLTNLVVHDATPQDLRRRNATLAILIVIPPMGRVVAVIPSDMSKVYEAAVNPPTPPPPPPPPPEEISDAERAIRVFLERAKETIGDIKGSLDQLEKNVRDMGLQVASSDSYKEYLMNIDILLQKLRNMLESAAGEIPRIPEAKRERYLTELRALFNTGKELEQKAQEYHKFIEEATKKKSAFVPGRQLPISGTVFYSGHPEEARVSAECEVEDDQWESCSFAKYTDAAGVFKDLIITPSASIVRVTATSRQNPGRKGRIEIDLKTIDADDMHKLHQLEIQLAETIHLEIKSSKEQRYEQQAEAQPLLLPFLFTIPTGFSIDRGKRLTVQPYIEDVQGRPITNVDVHKVVESLGPLDISSFRGTREFSVRIRVKLLMQTGQPNFRFGFRIISGNATMADAFYVLSPRKQVYPTGGEAALKALEALAAAATRLAREQPLLEQEITEQEHFLAEFTQFARNINGAVAEARKLEKGKPFEFVTKLKGVQAQIQYVLDQSWLTQMEKIQGQILQENLRISGTAITLAEQQIKVIGALRKYVNEPFWQNKWSLIDKANKTSTRIKEITTKMGMLEFPQRTVLEPLLERIKKDVTEHTASLALGDIANLNNKLQRYANQFEYAKGFLRELREEIEKMKTYVNDIHDAWLEFQKDMGTRGLEMPQLDA